MSQLKKFRSLQRVGCGIIYGEAVPVRTIHKAYVVQFLIYFYIAGFLIPLSGGLDSCSTATLVFSMARECMKAIAQGNEQVKADVQRIAGAYEEEGWLPKTPQELTERLL